MNYYEIIEFWKNFELPKLNPREIELKIPKDFILTLTGPRRAGKTFVCFQKINELIKKGIPKENIFYINFEDDRLLNADNNDLRKIYEMFMESPKINSKKNIYLFLDEIQNVKNWSAWVRTMYDTQKNIKFILTGSSSKLLSREISTNLRGRVYNKEILPLSFKEYLIWNKTNFKELYKNRIKIKKFFKEYLVSGGYPQVFGVKFQVEEILQGFYDSMIFRDILERHNLRDVKKIQILGKLIFESNSKEISYSKLSNKMKSLGFSIGKTTIIEYISYFEDAYLFFQLLKYEYSMQKQLGSIKKVYTVDNGLLNSVTFKFSDDFGKLLENLVFLEFYRKGKKVFYNRGKFECDFVVQKKNKILDVVQVCYELNEENRKREVNGLVEAMEKFKLKEGLILTYDEEEEFKIDGNKIIVKPVWKWLLE